MKKDWEVTSLCKLFEIRPPKKEAFDILGKNDLVSFVPMTNLGEQSKELTLNQKRKLSEVYSGYTYFAENDVLLANSLSTWSLLSSPLKSTNFSISF